MNRIAITINEKTLASIEARSDGNRSQAVAKTIERYADLMAAVKQQLAFSFSENECGLIIDVLNGAWLNDHINIKMLPYNVTDALTEGLDQKWGIDPEKIRRKITETTIAERYAIADAVLLWWKRDANDRHYGDLFKT